MAAETSLPQREIKPASGITNLPAKNPREIIAPVEAALTNPALTIESIMNDECAKLYVIWFTFTVL